MPTYILASLSADGCSPGYIAYGVECLLEFHFIPLQEQAADGLSGGVGECEGVFVAIHAVEVHCDILFAVAEALTPYLHYIISLAHSI